MNNKRVENAQDPTNAQDLATKNYIDTILSGFMKQVKVEAFTADGTFVVPVGATYAVAHMLAGGGGVGTSNAGTGGISSVDFVSGIITASGGIGQTTNLNSVSFRAGAANSGQGACQACNQTNIAGEFRVDQSPGNCEGGNGAEIVAGADVAFGQSIAVVVGLGGVFGGQGAAGGSGYVWIEYY